MKDIHVPVVNALYELHQIIEEVSLGKYNN
jgi:hypothetical protein